MARSDDPSEEDGGSSSAMLYEQRGRIRFNFTTPLSFAFSASSHRFGNQNMKIARDAAREREAAMTRAKDKGNGKTNKLGCAAQTREGRCVCFAWNNKNEGCLKKDCPWEHDNDNDNDTQRSPTSVDGGLALQARV